MEVHQLLEHVVVLRQHNRTLIERNRRAKLPLIHQTRGHVIQCRTPIPHITESWRQLQDGLARCATVVKPALIELDRRDRIQDRNERRLIPHRQTIDPGTLNMRGINIPYGQIALFSVTSRSISQPIRPLNVI